MAVIAYARLEGTQAVIESLQGFEGKVEEKVREAMISGAQVIAEDIKARAPIGTREPRKGAGVGRLKDSIKVRKIVGNKGAKLSIKIEADYPRNAGRRKNKTRKQAAGSKEYYAFAVEYGTRKMEAQPFMAPALAAKAQQVYDKMRSAMEEACREAIRTV